MGDRGLGLGDACIEFTAVGLRLEGFDAVEKNVGTFGKDEASLSETWSVCSFGMTGSISVGFTTGGAGADKLDAKFSFGFSSVFIVFLCVF